MRADQIIRSFTNPKFTAKQEARAAGVRFGIESALRMVLSPLVVETAAQLADPETVERTREHLFMPAVNLWLEWDGATRGLPGNAHAIHFVGLGGSDIRQAKGTCYFRHPLGGPQRWMIVPLWLDLAGNGPVLRIDEEQFKPIRDLHKDAPAIDERELGAFIGAALAIINTPRLSMQKPVSHGRSARSDNRPALLEHSIVTMTIDREELGLSVARTRTGEKPLHHVRAHIRLKRGRVELVRPHWRGDPQRGITVPRYVVRRKEDEAGPWRGGPAEPPQIIK